MNGDIYLVVTRKIRVRMGAYNPSNIGLNIYIISSAVELGGSWLV